MIKFPTRLLTALGLVLAVAGNGPAIAQAPRPATPAASPAPAVPAPVRPAAPKPPVAPAASPAAAPSAAPAPAPAASVAPATTPAAASKRIDVNSASEADLATLAGIGPVRAKAIVAGRPWASLDALAPKAVPAGVLSPIRNKLAVANINAGTAKDLQRVLPGIGDVRAGQIVAGRPYAAPEDLVSKGVLSQAVFDKIKDLITF